MSQNWKTPNEVIKIHKLKQKKRALQTRVEQKNVTKISNAVNNQSKCPLEAAFAQKRRNPFLKDSANVPKKQKLDTSSEEAIDEDTIFQLLNNPEQTKIATEKIETAKSSNELFNSIEFSNVINEEQVDDIEEHKSSPYLPIDWSIKTRMRVLCKSSIPGSSLKTSQEASGLTSFVRCIDPHNSSTGIDISPGARFYQGTFYWQQPHIPWFTLFPRNSKANIGIQIGEAEKTSLNKDWTESFRGLFQLLRARQCPYFYVCANTFTVIFRAAGIGGRVETHALLSPTSRGLRSALKQEQIEYSQPLKKDASLNKSNDSNKSLSNPSDAPNVDIENTEITDKIKNEEDEDDELEEDNWLASLGVESSEIKKINSTHARKKHSKEMSEDFSDNSIVLIEGAECQAFFNFLLNAKSTIANVGRLAGIPPTLLAPTAFPGATMRSLQTRSSKVRMDGNDYFSVELKGVILPHVLPYVSNLLCESKDSFSATLASSFNTLAFTKASKKLIENSEKENIRSDEVFGKENLSDCGLSEEIVKSMCRATSYAVSIMERMCYTQDEGYTWS